MPFTCSICEEESTRICARCTKDSCNNHLCEKCLRCSDCCECEVVLADESQQARVVVFAYPRTGEPDKDLPPGWDAIPGARGCTPQSCGFRDVHAEFARLGAAVYGLSTQTTEYQREMAGRLHLPFEVLSDAGLRFQRALKLPTFEVVGMTLLKRITLVLFRGEVEHVFYPVFPPDQNARQVLDWLRAKG